MIKIPSGYSKVDKYLIRGKCPSVTNLYKLKQEGVNQIYDFRHYSNFGLKFIERIMCKCLGIKYNRFAYSNLYGNYPTLDSFEKICSEVNDNGHKGGITLFHCNSGRHRTSHFSAFYALTKGKPLAEVRNSAPNEYNTILDKVIQEQILDKGYFNRTKKNYKGFNIFKRIYYSYNNRIFDGLDNAQKEFLRMTRNTTDKW